MEKKLYTLSEIAKITNSQLLGNPEHKIEGVASLDRASLTDASFLENPRYEQQMLSSKAGVIFVSENSKLKEDKNFLIHPNPSFAFQQFVDLLFKDKGVLTGFKDIHSTAVIHESCIIGKNVKIGPYAVLDMNVNVGDNSFIGSGTYVGPNVSIGSDCTIHPRVVIRERSLIGNRVILQPGVVIGSCGFGYITNDRGEHIKLDQLGIVNVEDDVEIGANTTIDRSRFEVTNIQKGSKIDNLVQIGHNVSIGPYNIIVSQTGIAGSTKTGRHVVIGGQSAVAGHLEIANGVMLAGRSGVTKSILKAGKYGGVPAQALSDHNRNNVFLLNIEKYIKIIKEQAFEIKAIKDTLAK